jgi:uncharacterized membrane protein
MSLVLAAGIVPLVLLVAGCSSGEGTLAEVDPSAVPADPDYDTVFAIIQRDCAPCHNSGGGGGDTSRWEGPRAAVDDDDPGDLTTCQGIIESLGEINQSIVNNTMPPGAWPRLTSEEKLVIERWMLNGAVAPCN